MTYINTRNKKIKMGVGIIVNSKETSGKLAIWL